MPSHRATMPAVLALLLAVLASSSPAGAIRDQGDPSREGGAYSLTVDGVFEVDLVRPAHQRTICETRNLTGAADPVLHVLTAPVAGGAVREITRNDNSAGGLNARVTFASIVPARVVLVMRAARAGASGTADLVCDGRPVGSGAPVGGAFMRLEALDERERLRTVTLPGGPRRHRLYLLDDAGAMLARIVASSADSVFIDGGLRGTRTALVGSVGDQPVGEIRLIRNDAAIAGRDPDGDGLGSRLEANIGTCSSRLEIAAGFDCSRASDARDTDGDGLQDGLELIGRLQAPAQHLPRWGADPRHKDVFIEVDFGMAERGEAPQRMGFGRALAFADLYADPEHDAGLRLAHAQSLANPDGQPGVSVHLDIGVAPPAGAPRRALVTYGDWGGFNVVQPVCDGAGCRRARAGAVWEAMMDPARRGIFHYALGDPGGGGQAGIHAIALNFPMGSHGVAAHEFGHTLGLNHSGGPHGLNCMPNYPSLMNYAYGGSSVGFSDGLGRDPLNDVSLRERGAVAEPASLQGRRYLDNLRRVYAFDVDPVAGDVDWDRDGTYSAQSVRGYATFQPDAGGCEATRHGQIRAAGLSDRAPALVRFGGRAMLFYIDERDRRIRLEIASGDLRCPQLEADCGRLEPRDMPFAWNRRIAALDAHPMVLGGGGRRLLLVFRAGNALFETVFDGSAWTPPRRITTAATPAGELSLAGTGGRIWLAFRSSAGTAILKARTLAGGWGPDEAILDTSGDAVGPIAGDASPGILLVNHRDGREVLLGAFPVGPQGMLRLYQRVVAPVTAPAGAPPAGLAGRWSPAPWPLASDPSTGAPVEEPVLGRPALAFEPTAPDSLLPGRIHLLYVRRGEDGRTVVMQGLLIARRRSGELRTWLQVSAHDNGWLYGRGVDLLFEPGVDTNLRAALASALLGNPGDPPDPHHVWLRPKADGIVDFTQRNFDDWRELGRGLCITLARNGAGVACPADH